MAGSQTDLLFLRSAVEKRKEKLIRANDRIHDYAELSYQETQSMGELTGILREEGFAVETGLADMPTCFTGTFGSGKPVMGILGEFDALDKLSQKGGVCKRAPLREGAPGHGCGHCTLGVGALAAALAHCHPPAAAPERRHPPPPAPAPSMSVGCFLPGYTFPARLRRHILQIPDQMYSFPLRPHTRNPEKYKRTAPAVHPGFQPKNAANHPVPYGCLYPADREYRMPRRQT